MKSNLLFCFISLLFAPLISAGQVAHDTTLQEVKIRAKQKVSGDMRLNDFSPGQKVQGIDSTTIQQYQLQNMADLLGQQVPVFIRSYGFNGLATLNFRGSSAAQSQVMWNGVPIQNAALGIADIATLPVLFINKVNIVYGGSAALWGSGNVGGALMMENDAPVFDSGRRSLAVSGGAGSFAQYTGGLRGTASGKKWYAMATAYGQTAVNDFSYTGNSGATANMTNGRLHSYAGIAQGAYKISKQNILSLSAWYQHYDREVPPALFEMGSSKEHLSSSFRLLADWNKQTGSNTWYAKSSVIKDDINYKDGAISFASASTAYQYYQEAGWKKRLDYHNQLLVFAPLNISWMSQPITDSLKQQHRIALVAAYNYRHFNNRLDVAVNARGEVINTQSIFLPGGGSSFTVTDWLSVRINAQRTYRAPTLNELYYNPGGNASLKPEQGWNEDAGYTLKANNSHLAIYHDLSVFNRNIKDWIIWLGGAIWTPHNIASVHSRGIETDNKLVYTTGKWSFHINLSTSYVLATTVSSYIRNDGSVGRQIPYVPRYNGRANCGFTYRQLSVSYIHTYTGYRFTTADESEYLLPYHTGNAQLMLNMAIRRHLLQLTAQCNNIWNTQYYVAGFRPMPGINYIAGFRLII